MSRLTENGGSDPGQMPRHRATNPCRHLNPKYHSRPRRVRHPDNKAPLNITRHKPTNTHTNRTAARALNVVARRLAANRRPACSGTPQTSSLAVVVGFAAARALMAPASQRLGSAAPRRPASLRRARTPCCARPAGHALLGTPCYSSSSFSMKRMSVRCGLTNQTLRLSYSSMHWSRSSAVRPRESTIGRI